MTAFLLLLNLKSLSITQLTKIYSNMEFNSLTILLKSQNTRMRLRKPMNLLTSMILNQSKVLLQMVKQLKITNNLIKKQLPYSPPKRKTSKRPMKCWLYGKEKRVHGTNASSNGFSHYLAGSRLTIQGLTSSNHCLCIKLKMSTDPNFSD
jgi:hypothetical protein